MTLVYLVVEDDWESNVVLHASLDKAWAEAKAAELDAPHEAARPLHPWRVRGRT